MAPSPNEILVRDAWVKPINPCWKCLLDVLPQNNVIAIARPTWQKIHL
jgi:hypothetical protein